MRDTLNHDTQELAILFKLDTESHHLFVSFYTQAGLTKQKVLKWLKLHKKINNLPDKKINVRNSILRRRN
jgi:hypothetical protein